MSSARAGQGKKVSTNQSKDASPAKGKQGAAAAGVPPQLKVVKAISPSKKVVAPAAPVRGARVAAAAAPASAPAKSAAPTQPRQKAAPAVSTPLKGVEAMEVDPTVSEGAITMSLDKL